MKEVVAKLVMKRVEDSFLQYVKDHGRKIENFGELRAFVSIIQGGDETARQVLTNLYNEFRANVMTDDAIRKITEEEILKLCLANF